MIVRELITKMGFKVDGDTLRRWNAAVDDTRKNHDKTAKAVEDASERQAAAIKEVVKAQEQLKRASDEASKKVARDALDVAKKNAIAARAAVAEAKKAADAAKKAYKEFGHERRDDMAQWLARSRMGLDRLAGGFIAGEKGAARFNRAFVASEARQARHELADMLSNSPRLFDRFVGGALRADEVIKNMSARALSLTMGLAKVAAIGGTVALGALGVAATNKAATFESLQAGLTTAEGGNRSRGLAEFERAREFAASTPFTLEEITSALLRLKNLGLDASNTTLTAFGNIAASFPGKTMLDFTEAVADAVTFEWERLKEFGIKAKVDGDKVAFTFRGITTEVAKTSSAVAEYLKGIGNTQFAGAMEAQMNTFRGVMSNLQDAWDAFLVDVASHGLLDAMKEIGKELTGMTSSSGELSESLGVMLAKSVRALWKLFKDVQPSLVDLIVRFSEFMVAADGGGEAIAEFIGLIAGFVSSASTFVEAVGGMENALYLLAPAIAAVTMAMLGLAGVPALIAVAAAATAAAIPGILNNSAETFEGQFDARQGQRATGDRKISGAMDVAFRHGTAIDSAVRQADDASLQEVARGKWGGGPGRLAGMAHKSAIDAAKAELIRRDLSKAKTSATAAGSLVGLEQSRQSVDAAAKVASKQNADLKATAAAMASIDRKRLLEVAGGAMFGGRKVSEEDRKLAQVELVRRDLAAGAKTAERLAKPGFLAGFEAEQESSGRKGRGGKKKKKEEGLSVNDILERDFGGGLGQKIETDDGRFIRPTLGTTINKITNHYNPQITQNFEIEQRPGESGPAFEERTIREAVDQRLAAQMREAYEHFKGS